MVLTLVLSALAGFASRPAEPRITEFLVSLVGQDNLPQEADRRVASVLLCGGLAALVLWVGSDAASPLVFVIGLLAGYFQQEIREAILTRQR